MSGRTGRDLPIGVTRRPENRKVLDYLREHRPSAHDDVTDAMIEAARPIGGIHSYTPDAAAYAYQLLHTDDGMIFAVALGQSHIALRLASTDRSPDLMAHAEEAPELGDAWVRVHAFPAEVPLRAWRSALARAMRSAVEACG